MRRATTLASIVLVVAALAGGCGDSDTAAAEDMRQDAASSDVGGAPDADVIASNDALADVTLPPGDASDADVAHADVASDALTDTADAAGDAGTDADATPIACDRQGFVSGGSTTALVIEDRAGNPEQLDLRAETTDSEPTDVLYLTLRYAFGASDGAHVFAFDGQVFQPCHTCLRVEAGCTGSDGCDKTFLPMSGSLVVSANGGVGGAFTGTLTSVVLAELGFDPDTGQPALVADGERWCIDLYSFDETIALDD